MKIGLIDISDPAGTAPEAQRLLAQRLGAGWPVTEIHQSRRDGALFSHP